jgi:hypothetical protein
LPTKRRRRTSTFGHSRKLPSGRWQARYPAPDGQNRYAPDTFDTKAAADDWLAQMRLIIRGGRRWVNPDQGARLFEPYALSWVAERDLKERTREHYRQILDRHLVPASGISGWTRSARPWSTPGTDGCRLTVQRCARTATRYCARSWPPPSPTS